jgi:hypothetical protein
MEKKKQQVLMFAYQLLWDRYMEIYRTRKMPTKEIGLAILEVDLKTMQKFMVRDCGMKVTFKDFPKRKP